MEKTDSQSLNTLATLFKDKWNITLHTYDDIFNRTDCWFHWKDKSFEVEVKRRRFDSHKYPTTIINYEKYKELVKRKAILVVMFDDKWGILKNVRSGYLRTTPMYAKSTTDWDGEYRWSNKVELNLDSFTWYEY